MHLHLYCDKILIMRILAFAIFGIITLSSCSKQLTPFNQEMVREMNWNDEDLERIQFYLSENIVLRREARSGDASIREGKIKVIKGRKVEEIVFQKGTPGVFLFSPNSKNVAIAFEEGEDRYLMFGPSPKFNNRYVLLAKDWKKHSGQITYDGKVYDTPSGSAFASLMVDLEKARNHC